MYPWFSSLLIFASTNCRVTVSVSFILRLLVFPLNSSTNSQPCSFISGYRSYALVLSENHVYTSGAGGTNAAAIRGALRAERPDLLTVILPQSFAKQSRESQDLLKGVTDLVTMPQNDNLSLDLASRICNSRLLGETDQLIAFAFHDSTTVIEATNEAKSLDMLVTVLYLD